MTWLYWFDFIFFVCVSCIRVLHWVGWSDSSRTWTWSNLILSPANFFFSVGIVRIKDLLVVWFTGFTRTSTGCRIGKISLLDWMQDSNGNPICRKKHRQINTFGSRVHIKSSRSTRCRIVIRVWFSWCKKDLKCNIYNDRTNYCE